MKRDPLRVIVRASLAHAGLCVVIAGVCGTLGAELIRLPIGELLEGARGRLLIVRTIFSVPLGVLCVGSAVMLLGYAVRGVVRFLVPQVVDCQGDAVRLRVASRWGRRTEMWVARASIREVALRPNQFAASFALSITLDTGATVCISEDVSPDEALRLAANLEHMIRFASLERWPLPIARVA